MSTQDGVKIEHPMTVGMKRRAVLRVLRSAAMDARRDIGASRVSGIFGIVIHEDGTAHVLSAVTMEELKIVMKALPEALQRVSTHFLRGGDESPTQ
jgi:hypothetical protein